MKQLKNILEGIFDQSISTDGLRDAIDKHILWKQIDWDVKNDQLHITWCNRILDPVMFDPKLFQSLDTVYLETRTQTIVDYATDDYPEGIVGGQNMFANIISKHKLDLTATSYTDISLKSDYEITIHDGRSAKREAPKFKNTKLTAPTIIIFNDLEDLPKDLTGECDTLYKLVVGCRAIQMTPKFKEMYNTLINEPGKITWKDLCGGMKVKEVILQCNSEYFTVSQKSLPKAKKCGSLYILANKMSF